MYEISDYSFRNSSVQAMASGFHIRYVNMYLISVWLSVIMLCSLVALSSEVVHHRFCMHCSILSNVGASLVLYILLYLDAYSRWLTILG